MPDLWLDDCSTSRRPHQTIRNPYKPREKKGGASSESLEDEEESGSSSEQTKLTLDRWDQWFMNSDDTDDSVSKDELLAY